MDSGTSGVVPNWLLIMWITFTEWIKMWKNSKLIDILKRLERLESEPRWAQSEDTLGDLRVEMDGLAASQEATISKMETIAANFDAFGGVNHELTKELNSMKLAISEGIERVDRAERRIKSTVARARKELAERGLTDDGLEAENYELQLLDGAGSETKELPAVSEVVDEPIPPNEFFNKEITRAIPGRF